MVAPAYLRSLQALELSVRRGSFVAAADELGITPAAVGQRVKALEDHLGVELLERGRAGIRLTSGAAPALPHLQQGFQALEAAARELEMQRAQELHIAAVSDFVDLWLFPRLSRYRADHPNLTFRINGEGDAPMRLGRVDCEIRYGSPDDGDLLFRDFVLPIASPGIIERISRLEPGHGLEGFPLAHVDFYKDDPAGLSWPHWTQANAVRRTAPERGLRFQRITSALDAVEANAGLAMCGLALLSEQLAQGRIGLPFPVETGRWSEHAFVARFRPSAEGRRPVQRFRAWLAEEARATQAALEHQAPRSR